MTTNCEALRAFNSLESRVFENVSLASRLAAHVKNRANTVSITITLWRVNRNLGELFDGLHDMLEGRKPIPQPKEALTKQQTEHIVDNIEYLHRMLDYLLESSRRARLTNNSLTAGPLCRLKTYCGELLDLANWIQATIDPKVKSAFERAAKESESGEIYELSQVD